MNRPMHMKADGTLQPFTDDMMRQRTVDEVGEVPPQLVPDGPTLGDWRTGLVLWNRLDRVDSAIAALKASGDEIKRRLGKVAEQRFQYSNNVFRAQLLAFKDDLGFTEAEVDESLWRADRVAKGDLSGVYP